MRARIALEDEEWRQISYVLRDPETVRPAMPDDAVSTVVYTLFEALNAHEADRAAHELAEAYQGLDATRSAVTVGREEARAEIRAGLHAFDPTFSIQHCMADPPHVVTFWRMEAVHKRAFLQIPPTNRSLTVPGVSLFAVRDGRIVKGVHLWDLAAFLRAVNLLPDLPSDQREKDRRLEEFIA